MEILAREVLIYTVDSRTLKLTESTVLGVPWCIWSCENLYFPELMSLDFTAVGTTDCEMKGPSCCVNYHNCLGLLCFGSFISLSFFCFFKILFLSICNPFLHMF